MTCGTPLGASNRKSSRGQRRGWIALAAAIAIVALGTEALRGQEPQSGGGRIPERADDDGGGDDEPFNTDRLLVPRWRLTNGPHVWAAFRPVVERARQATVRIRCDNRVRGIGGIVGADGWILTKATPLCGEVTCVLADGRELAGVNVATNREYDLALIKVEDAGLPTLDLSEGDVPAIGSWLATVGTARDPVAVGVVSVGPRQIPPQAGRLGILLNQDDEPRIEQVVPEGAAAEAGLRDGDVVVSVDGHATPTGTEIRKTIGSFNPGDTVTVVVRRDGKELSLQATLQGSIPGLEGRSDFQNNLGGRLSVRRFGFPLALQHDTALRPSECGGPVVDLDGRVVGFNIARAGRTESYMIPTSALPPIIAELKVTGLATLEKLRKAEQVSAEAAKAEPERAIDDSADAGAAPRDAAAPETLSPSRAAAAYADEGYHLAWADEFNANGRPDPAKWTYERGFVRNEELQWYRPDNAVCKDGQLVIEGRRERVANPRFESGSSRWQRNREFAEYTSASLTTRDLAEWKLGRFEMRGRIDVRPGLWPAFWTLGHGSWPQCGEIDVMEFYGDTLLANVAWGFEGSGDRWRAVWDDSRTPLTELGGEAWAKQFHVWRMDWDAESITLSVDGRVLNETDTTKATNNDDGDNPFQAPHWIILNLAIGGTHGGDALDTTFPARFEVDYVRVYQK